MIKIPVLGLLVSLLICSAGFASENVGASSPLASIGERLGLGGAGPEFLEPDRAFVFSADVSDPGTITARWMIADGYYLYRDKFTFRLTESPVGIALGEARFPPGEFKEDEYFGRMEVFHGPMQAAVPVERQGAAPTTITLEVGYQGCADQGFCYPPMKRTVRLELPVMTATAPVASSAAAMAGVGEGSAEDKIARSLAEGNLWLNLAGFFGFGLLLAFTPCVLPMVPILSSLIIGQRTQVTTRQAFLLSLSYVLAMALTYTLAGVAAGLFGNNLQAAFQNPWILGGISVIFVLLALAMFDVYQLQLPASWQARLNDFSNRQSAGTYIGAAVMGFLSALVVGPCVAAPLAGILLYIGISGDAVLGGVSLFALSLGMGLPLLVIGTSAGRLLPKAGGWMTTVKAVFGVMMLAVAIWFLDRIVPPQFSMILWAVLLVGMAVYLGAFDRMEAGVSGWRRLWKGAGLIVFIYGVLLIIGAAGGGGDPLRPLQGTSVTGGSATAAQSLEFDTIKGAEGLRQAMARAGGRPVMLDFYADWCVDCKIMERRTFTDPGVRAALAGAVLLRADVTANDEIDQGLLKQLGLFGPPAILFFGADGKELRSFRVIGYTDPEAFARHIQQALM
ncbi:MAG: protein-disulfide reductase DsbD [Gammaproteobacteria bacterium]|nr:protein-disulfide reductase DsbD [Gammaproteobacteria bacterium]